MREARVGDHWKTVYQRNYASYLISFTYQDILGLGSGAVDFHGGITAVCGANGVGKTALLSAILGIASPESVEIGKSVYVQEAKLAAELRAEGVLVNRTFDVKGGIASPEELRLEVIWIDCPSQCPTMISLFSATTNLEEQLEAEGFQELSEGELGLLSYVVGKNYSQCKCFELEFAEFGIIPYFRVSCDGATYGTESMGLGELSAHFISWHLRRAKKNAIVLIEEPETYLAPKSQEAVVNVLAQVCCDKGIWAVLTTHSPAVLANIPPRHVRFLSRVAGKVQVITPKNRLEYFQTLGIPILKSGVIFTEDRAAREFATVWMSHFDPFLVQEVEIKQLDGTQSVWDALAFPRTDGWLRVVGLLDGDAITRTSEYFDSPKKKANWPYVFLPGEKPPEDLLRQTANRHVPALAERLSRPHNLVHAALGSLEGKNHHDWLVELPRSLGVSYQNLVKALFDIWVTDPSNADMAQQAFECLREALTVKPHTA